MEYDRKQTKRFIYFNVLLCSAYNGVLTQPKDIIKNYPYPSTSRTNYSKIYGTPVHEPPSKS
jgi:hypothetical protein